VVVASVLALAAVGASVPVMAQDASASPEPPGQASVVSLGATTELFADGFTPADAWGRLDEESASIQPEDGGLRFRLLADDQSRWSWRTLDRAVPVLRFGIDASLGEGSGSGGVLCGSSGADPSFFLGVVNNAGEWVLGRIVDSTTTVIARDVVPGLQPGGGPPVRVELECAVTGEGGDRVALFVDGVNVADHTDASSFGPFDKAGLYASVATQPFEVLFDDARALGGDTFAPEVTLGPSPSPEASPDPSAGPVGGPGLTSLGATTVIHDEPFDDESVWGVTRGDRGSIAYDEGALRVTLRPSNNALWSWLTFPEGAGVLGVEAALSLDPGAGAAGPMCGSTEAEPRFIYATVGRQGDVSVGTITGSRLEQLDRVPIPGGPDAVRDGEVRLRLECGVVGDGTDRVAAWVNDVLVADLTTPSSIGPFGRAGVLGTNGDRRWSATFDDLVVRTGPALAPVGEAATLQPTDAPLPTLAPDPSVAPPTPLPVGQLLQAVPDAFREDCRAVAPDAGTGQLEAVLCAPAGDARSAEYYRYDSAASLEAAFEAFLERAAVAAPGTDCTLGPTVVDYTIDGRSAGRLACYQAARGGGVTVQWTNLDLLVLAFGSHASDAFADAYAWWQDAGPRL
jgi:hypothetical protein